MIGALVGFPIGTLTFLVALGVADGAPEAKEAERGIAAERARGVAALVAAISRLQELPVIAPGFVEITTFRTTRNCCGIIGRNGSLAGSEILAWLASVPSLTDLARWPDQIPILHIEQVAHQSRAR